MWGAAYFWMAYYLSKNHKDLAEHEQVDRFPLPNLA